MKSVPSEGGFAVPVIMIGEQNVGQELTRLFDTSDVLRIPRDAGDPPAT